MGLNPMERSIFDETPYFGDISGYIDKCRQETLDALAAYFEGRPSDLSSTFSEHSGNPLIAAGCIGRWNGTRTGFSVFEDFKDMLSGPDSPFKDCEIEKIWDENGHLFIHGTHHDGSVTVELKQLSDAGREAYDEIAEAWVGESFTVAGNDATDWKSRTYDGSARSVSEAMLDLWNEPSFCCLPCYLERAFGYPAEEWDTPETDEKSAGEPSPGVSLKVEARSARDAAESLGGNAPSLEVSR